MRSFSVFATASLAALATALPEPIFGRSKILAARDGSCMSAADARSVVDNFKRTLVDYSEAEANVSFTAGFHDYTDSVIELIDNGCTGPVPQGSATFDSLASFEGGQGAQAPIPFEQLNIWYNCDSVFLRWRTTIADGAPQFVTGIIVFEAVQAPSGNKYPWLINTVYSEFNSGAWLVDVGSFVPQNCSSGARRMLRA